MKTMRKKKLVQSRSKVIDGKPMAKQNLNLFFDSARV